MPRAVEPPAGGRSVPTSKAGDDRFRLAPPHLRRSGRCSATGRLWAKGGAIPEGFYFKVRYPRARRWVTLAVFDVRSTAARVAAEAYPERRNGRGETPWQVRVVSAGQLRREGGRRDVRRCAAAKAGRPCDGRRRRALRRMRSEPPHRATSRVWRPTRSPASTAASRLPRSPSSPRAELVPAATFLEADSFRVGAGIATAVPTLTSIERSGQRELFSTPAARIRQGRRSSCASCQTIRIIRPRLRPWARVPRPRDRARGARIVD